MEIITKTRKWGNSIAIILPKFLVELNKLKENQVIRLEIKTKPLVSDFFGKFPRKSRRSAQEIKDEARKGW